MTSERYESWFKMVPIELYVTEAKLSKSKITMEMGLKCNMQTMVGQQPKNGFDASKITLKPVSSIPEKTTASVVAVSTYESASNIVTKNFQGQEFGSGSRKITVQKVALWHKDGKIVKVVEVKVQLPGGSIILKKKGLTFDQAVHSAFRAASRWVSKTKSRRRSH
jgi:ribosome-associated translation inhibitor RaiA